jgi:hypothetical protein
MKVRLEKKKEENIRLKNKMELLKDLQEKRL